MFACFSPLALAGKKNHSKGFSKAAEGSKKRSSRSRHRVKPVDFVSNSIDHLETINETISKSFPSVEKPSHTIPNAPMDDAESIRDVSYEGDGEQQSETIESLKGDCSAEPEGELVIHDGSSDGIAREATAASNSDIEGETTLLESDQNQSVALFSGCLDRINAWVDRLEDCSFSQVDAEDYCDKIQDCVVTSRNQSEEGIGGEAKNIIQSLNISSIGLKLIPSMAGFVCLRSVNLSGNCIVEITPGSLPKSLHTLDLSHNEISTVEGLRGLERLRILNLSYNRITRIGHGLSSCTLIKELYLAGNKIGNVEGLHRILKMKVLDLGFNKITTAKGLGQLVSNYNSLLALNLTGNPVQANIGNDQLQKEVQGLLPHLSYLNKLPIKPLKIREVATKCVAKAAVGDAARRISPQRKITRRLSGIGSSASSSTIKTGGNLREASPKATPFRPAIKRRSKSELSTPASIDYSRRRYSMIPAV